MRPREGLEPSYFNPRTHVGCDLSDLCSLLTRVRFQSTHPRGVRHTDCAEPLEEVYFNPRTHVGCDRDGRARANVSLYFNPRTHVGCDVSLLLIFSQRSISIHAPTWGATVFFAVFLQMQRYISIHAPTWGATGLRARRAREHTPISIHAPTWGATDTHETFKAFRNNFNPRTHVGCDDVLKMLSDLQRIFQSTHPRGVRPERLVLPVDECAFQSTHPRGVRLQMNKIGA